MRSFAKSGLLLSCAAAAAFVSALAYGADTKAGVPDLSGMWEGPGFDLDPLGKGPGPVTNISKDIQKPEGDDKNPILQPWAAEVVKKHGEESLAGITFGNPSNQCWPLIGGEHQ